jgi:hydroxymethylpyrimidine/phosphomethylpyrimidine kinase
MPTLTVHPVVLVFAAFDPTGSDGLPADAVTCAALGVHALSVLTSNSVQDSAETESVQPFTPDQIDDQARCLLEDMSVQAIKVGAISSTEGVSAIAQIAADYSDVPLVLHLGAPSAGAESLSDQEENDERMGAMIELLIPQSKVVVAEARHMDEWIDEELLEATEQQSAPKALQAMGADWIMVLGHLQRPGHRINLLVGPDNQTISLPWVAPPERLRDAGGMVATALCALIARGASVTAAAEMACKYLERAQAQAFRPGMGGLIADRMASET